MATNGSTAKENTIIGIVPKHQGYFYDGHGDWGAFILIGYLDEEPIYRTTHTLAHYLEGNQPGEFCIHWPPVFPNLRIPECGKFGQLDVTVRKEVGPPLPPLEGDTITSGDGYYDYYPGDGGSVEYYYHDNDSVTDYYHDGGFSDDDVYNVNRVGIYDDDDDDDDDDDEEGNHDEDTDDDDDDGYEEGDDDDDDDDVDDDFDDDDFDDLGDDSDDFEGDDFNDDFEGDGFEDDFENYNEDYNEDIEFYYDGYGWIIHAHHHQHQQQ